MDSSARGWSLAALISLACIHFLVDSYGGLVAPLWPLLESAYGISAAGVTVLFGMWQIAASMSQPLFAWVGDRWNARSLLWLGPLATVVGLTLIGAVERVELLFCSIVLGGLGIGAFHPEVAVRVAESAGPRAMRALSIFVFGGMLGVSAGPLISGWLVEHYGRHSLVILLPIGLLLLGSAVTVYRVAMRNAGMVEVSERCAEGDGRAMPREVRAPVPASGERIRTLGRAVCLLGIATTRVTPVVGIPLALAYTLHRQGTGEAAIGQLQALFFFAGCVGTLLCPALTRSGREWEGLFAVGLLAAGFMTLLALATGPVLFVIGLLGAGLSMQGAMPLLIAYSQRVLPNGRRLAASLTLGASWGIAGVTVAALHGWLLTSGQEELLFVTLMPFSVAAVLGLLLLKPQRPWRADYVDEQARRTTSQVLGRELSPGSIGSGARLRN
ncbi:MAG: hypothetical protein C4297_14415 [Gemmataceae bacterium]